MIADRTLHVLEFDKLLRRMADRALTPMGAEACLALRPYTTLAEAQSAQLETEEACVVLAYTGSNPLSGFDDVRAQLTLAAKGAVLSPAALLAIARLLRAGRSAKHTLEDGSKNIPILRGIAAGLMDLRNVEEDISTAILSEEEIADRASSALADIRRHLRGAEGRIKDKLNQMTRSADMAKYLQDAIVTVRNGRYVLPVRAEYRAQVPGLIHDQSSSGATLFIEPLAAVEMGNELKQWELKEKQEIERILAALSAEIAPYAETLLDNLLLLTRLDFIFAKAALSRSMRGIAPKLNDQGRIRIVRGRHPLIPDEKVVPSTLWIGEDFTSLMITGPNTGGKTVTLKTVGLFTLLAQAGLQVPADLGTELAVFGQVFADIGDEQSIEQSLSTFSGHMTQIVQIMREVLPNDLVLFDELGAGTDPTEGAALAQAIIARLLQMKVRTIATTHYSELKAYALATPGVENASVEFNVETLRPTYRLSIGVPGKSNAFEISRKLGLSEAIVQDARELLSGNALRFEDVIANAEYHRQVAEKERLLAEQAAKETTRLRDEAEQLRREMEDKRENSLRKAKEQARRILEDARREGDGILADLKKMRKQAQEGSVNDANALLRQLDRSADALHEQLRPQQDASAAPATVQTGDAVQVLSIGQKGTVLNPPNAKGEVAVQVGSMRMNVPLSSLRLLPKQDQPKKKKTSVTRATDPNQAGARMSCDLRGLMVDEAMTVVDQYLDEAVLSSLNEVTIIHGKGTGALRAGIQQYLRHHPHVKSMRLGEFGEGDAGVTVVTLK